MLFFEKLKAKKQEEDTKLEEQLERNSAVSAFAVSKDQRNARLDICKSCEHFLKLTASCKECGCFMKAKTWLSSAKCPVDKW